MEPGRSWLGRQDSNLGMAESKSNWFSAHINAHSETPQICNLNQLNGLVRISECGVDSSGLRWTSGLGF
jgi:hypothetical protein